jgi:hypothetical protein
VARWDYYLARNAFYIDAAEFFPRGYSVSFWTGLQLDEVYEKELCWILQLIMEYILRSWDIFIRNLILKDMCAIKKVKKWLQW